MMNASRWVEMTKRELERNLLLARRDLLVRHFHDAIELADRELDACELEAAIEKSAQWEARVLDRLGGELHELHDVIAALARIDRRRHARHVT
ncbi:MAG: hypothetical protein QM831_01315 [Kofleriaceae bacterium]